MFKNVIDFFFGKINSLNYTLINLNLDWTVRYYLNDIRKEKKS